MRRLPTPTIPPRMPIHRRRLHEDPRPAVPKRRRPQPQRLQEADRLHVQRVLEVLRQAAEAESGQLRGHHGRVAEGAERRMPQSDARERELVRQRDGERRRGAGQGVSEAEEFRVEGVQAGDFEGGDLFGQVLQAFGGY